MKDRRSFRLSVLLIISVLSGCSSSPLRIEDSPTLNQFLSRPLYSNVAISPDGNLIAVGVGLTHGGTGLSVINLNTMEPVSATNYGAGQELSRIGWASNTRLVLQPAYTRRGVTAGNVATGEIYGIDIDGGNSKYLFGPRNFYRQKNKTNNQDDLNYDQFAFAEFIHSLPESEDEILILTRPYSNGPQHVNLFRLNVNSGDLIKLESSDNEFTSFIPNIKGEIVFKLEIDDGYNRILSYRPSGDDEFQVVSRNQLEEGYIYPVWGSAQSEKYYAVSDLSTGYRGIALYDPLSSDPIELLYSHSEVDFSSYYLDDVSGELVYVKWEDPYPSYKYFNKDHPVAILHNRLRNLYPQQHVDIISGSQNGARLIAKVSGDTIPGKYFLLDVNQVDPIYLYDNRPWLTKFNFSPMEGFSIIARDGTTINGFLTLPKKQQGRKRPLVVMVHGGPYGVWDTWGFNSDVQLLAAWGFAVLQVNYRGSGGRGLNFELAGYGEGSAKIQDDITDATLWAISNSNIDAERVCIYGASYGGYAALAGAFKEPSLYKCAAGFAGVYDLSLTHEVGDLPESAAGISFINKTIGNDLEFLKERSPAYNANKITAKVLLAHGDSDQRVPMEHASQLRSALIEAGNPPEYYIYENEGHGFASFENEKKFTRRLLDFFYKNLVWH